MLVKGGTGDNHGRGAGVRRRKEVRWTWIMRRMEGPQRIELDIYRSEFVASAMHHSEGKMVIKNIDRPFAMYILNIFILISV